jgi:hypothetical protein
MRSEIGVSDTARNRGMEQQASRLIDAADGGGDIIDRLGDAVGIHDVELTTAAAMTDLKRARLGAREIAFGNHPAARIVRRELSCQSSTNDAGAARDKDGLLSLAMVATCVDYRTQPAFNGIRGFELAERIE